jgi:DNA repair exonuclease SbcCD ATPase subunit
VNSERIDRLVDRLEVSSRRFAVYEGRKDQLEQLLSNHENNIEQCRDLDISYQKLQKFFQLMGSNDQERLQRWFEQVITYGLQTVFGNVYRFVIIGPEIKGNEIAIRFAVMKRSGDVELERDPYGEMGGGIADVLAFLLQFTMVFLLRDRINPVLFLDEAFKHLASEHNQAMADLLNELVTKTGVQIVLVTHEPLFATKADIVYRFEHDGKETRVIREH